MSDQLPDRLAREAVRQIRLDHHDISDDMIPVVFSPIYQPIHDAVRMALDEAVAIARRHAVESAHMNTQWEHGSAGVAAATECAERIAAAIEALK